MIKNPDMICKVMPGHKACMFCKEKNLRCFQVPQEYDAELKALIAAKRDYDLEHSETTSLRVKAQAEKLHELVAQAMANTPKRSRRSKDLTADELTEKARTESPLKRSTRQRRGRSGTRAIMLDDDGDDNDHDMEEQPPSPRAQPALGTRNLFGSIESRRPPVTVAAEKPLDVNLASSAELNRKLDELLQINTWTMRKSRAMAQSLMVRYTLVHIKNSEANMICRILREPWRSSLCFSRRISSSGRKTLRYARRSRLWLVLVWRRR